MQESGVVEPRASYLIGPTDVALQLNLNHTSLVLPNNVRRTKKVCAPTLFRQLTTVSELMRLDARRLVSTTHKFRDHRDVGVPFTRLHDCSAQHWVGRYFIPTVTVLAGRGRHCEYMMQGGSYHYVRATSADWSQRTLRTAHSFVDSNMSMGLNDKSIPDSEPCLFWGPALEDLTPCFLDCKWNNA